VNDVQSILNIARHLLDTTFAEGMKIRLLGITVSNLDKKINASSQLTLQL